MDFDGRNDDSNEMWELREEDYNLPGDSGIDISEYLLDDTSQNDRGFLYMMDEQTPIKDCMDFDHQVLDSGDNTNMGLECRESRDSSQLKRRRMLQFTSGSNHIGPSTYNQNITSGVFKYKASEDSLVGDGSTESSQWDSQLNTGFPDDRVASGFEGFNQQSSYGCPVNSLKESDLRCSPDEMALYNDNRCDQVDVSGFYDVSRAIETNMVQEKPPRPSLKILKGKRSFIKTPTKLTTSIVYPFALIKPCGVQGDVTLKDINQRIHAPPPSLSKPVIDNTSFPYATSAFTGKPVVVKTKIRTEGGKGSITIMRTKG